MKYRAKRVSVSVQGMASLKTYRAEIDVYKGTHSMARFECVDDDGVIEWAFAIDGHFERHEFAQALQAMLAAIEPVDAGNEWLTEEDAEDAPWLSRPRPARSRGEFRPDDVRGMVRDGRPDRPDGVRADDGSRGGVGSEADGGGVSLPAECN